MTILANVSVYAFPEVVLVSSIPVFSIIVRYNLIESGLMRKHWANIWSVLVPWVVAIPFYTGNILCCVVLCCVVLCCVVWCGVVLRLTQSTMCRREWTE